MSLQPHLGMSSDDLDGIHHLGWLRDVIVVAYGHSLKQNMSAYRSIPNSAPSPFSGSSGGIMS